MLRINKMSIDRNWELPIIKSILQITLFEYCDEESRSTLATLFKQFDEITCYHNAKDKAVKKLLQHTAKGEAESAVKMAKQNFLLPLMRSSFKEEWCGQREWKHPISPLEYTGWCGDTNLRRDFLELIPTSYKYDALLQLKKVKQNGTEYGTILSPIYRLKHCYEEYNFRLKRCYEEYNFRSVNMTMTYDERVQFWINVIGKNQLHSVAYLLQWLLEGSHHNTLPNYNTSPSRDYMIAHIGHHSSTPRIQLKLDLSSPLGVSHAIYKDGVYLFPRDFSKYVLTPAPSHPAYLWDPKPPLDTLELDFLCKSSKKILMEDISTLERDVPNNNTEQKHPNHTNANILLKANKTTLLLGGIAVLGLFAFIKNKADPIQILNTLKKNQM